jgi:thiamine biosynthesis lipoprotein
LRPCRLGAALLALAFPSLVFPPTVLSQAATTETRLLLGTVVKVTLWGAAPPGPAADDAFAAVAAVDGEMARRPGTALDRLNRAGGGTVSEALGRVVSAALEWARRSRGTFDPTVAPLLDLWDVGAAPHPPPSPQALRRALARVGWQRVHLDPASRRIDLGGTALDLGGIAKGFALDAAARALRARGLKDFLIDAGGDVLVAGSKGGRPWRVGIQDPSDPGSLLRVVEPRDGVLLTSGDYQRAFEWKGVRYHHLLDPRTGLPSRNCRSATLWAPAATSIPSAAVFLLGPGDGLALAGTVPGVEALLVDARGRVVETPGFARAAPPAGPGHP